MRSLPFLRLLKRTVINIDEQAIYDKIFEFMIINDLCEVPLSIDKIAKILNVDFKPLSAYIEAGFKESEVFSVWGNEDGVVHQYNEAGKSYYKISYNDTRNNKRYRFTIMEEFSHIILGHTNDYEFNIFNQRYSNKKYKQYDMEARICAGILIMPPNLYYEILSRIPVSLAANILEISVTCANTRYKIYNKYKKDILSNFLYDLLPPPCINIEKMNCDFIYKAFANQYICPNSHTEQFTTSIAL